MTTSATPAGGATGSPLLRLRSVTRRFGGLVAVDSVELTIPAGAIYAVIGPNGAGKTTLFNLITGVYQLSEGDVDFDGASLQGLKPHQITKRGIARTFQNIRLFPNMSALENVMVGADAHHKSSVLSAIFGIGSHAADERDGRERGQELLDFVGIGGTAELTAKNLSYGDQRRLEIARALATKPRLVLLDEPAAGMNPSERSALQGLIQRIRNSGVTVLLIEHDMSVVMSISDRVAVLDFGKLIAEGTPDEIQSNPDVIRAYLGEAIDA
ncbi:MAG: livG [Frankiales bacterium]|nr:livG [Frankiales bacterium]